MTSFDRTTIAIDHTIDYLLHNNLLGLLKNRPISEDSPTSYFERLNEENKETEHENDDLEYSMNKSTEITSSNINIILNCAALTESAFEGLLIKPFGALGEKISTNNDLALNILKDELAKVSSLGRYYNYFNKIYGKKVKSLITGNESLSIKILFDLRNMIIHASSLKGKTIVEPERKYHYVDDPFYKELLGSIIKLMLLNEEFYCLPESLISWNNLINLVIKNTSCALDKVYFFSKSTYPECSFRMHFIPVEHIKETSFLKNLTKQ